MHSFNLKYYSFIQLMFRMCQYDLGDFFTIVAKDSKVLTSIQLPSEDYLEHWELLGTIQLVSQRIIPTWKRKQLQSYSKVPYKDRNLMMEAEGFQEAVAEHESNWVLSLVQLPSSKGRMQNDGS